MDLFIKQLISLIEAVGVVPALLIISCGILVYYCRILIRDNNLLHQNVNTKLLESEEREKDCRQQYQEIREELRIIRNDNNELIRLNKEYELRLKESQQAQQAIMNTFTKTVEQFMERNE